MSATPVEGDLLVDRTIDTIKVKTAFQFLTEQALSKSAADWSKPSGVSEPGYRRRGKRGHKPRQEGRHRPNTGA
jgi:hypothetical protein